MTDVIDALREADQRTTPPHQFDFNAALRAGQARLRRRRLAQVATALSIPAVVAAIVLVVPGGDSAPSPAPPAETNDVDLPDFPERERVEPSDAFTIFAEPQTEDDKIPADAPSTSELTASTIRKLAVYGGVDLYVAQKPAEDLSSTDNLICLVYASREDLDNSGALCGGGISMPVDSDVNLGPILRGGNSTQSYSLWPDYDAEPPASEHAGWAFITPNLAVASPHKPRRTWWPEWLNNAAQYYQVFGEPQQVSDLLPEAHDDELKPWSSRLLGEYGGLKYWLGLREEGEICLVTMTTNDVWENTSCKSSAEGDDLNQPGMGSKVDGTSRWVMSVPDDYEPTDTEKRRWTYISPNLVVYEDPE